MTLQDYFKDKPHGARTALARDLGISKTWMSGVITGRELPSAELCLEIERLTGVLRATLRPDLFGEIL